MIINKKSVYFHHIAVDMAILAGYDGERFRRCPTEESIKANIYRAFHNVLRDYKNLL